MNIYHAIVLVIALYVVLESVHAMMRMDGGDKLCRVLKYIFTALSGFVVIQHSWRGAVTTGEFYLIFSLALFLWPTMLYRIRGEYRNRINDK